MYNHITKVSNTCHGKVNLGNNCSENLQFLHKVKFSKSEVHDLHC